MDQNMRLLKKLNESKPLIENRADFVKRNKEIQILRGFTLKYPAVSVYGRETARSGTKLNPFAAGLKNRKKSLFDDKGFAETKDLFGATLPFLSNTRHESSLKKTTDISTDLTGFQKK